MAICSFFIVKYLRKSILEFLAAINQELDKS